MSKRRVIIDGQPRQEKPAVVSYMEPVPSIPEDVYDYQANLLRKVYDPIRYKNDYWPTVKTFPLEGYPILEKINVPTELRPEGCKEIWYVRSGYDYIEDDANRVWALTARTRGGLINVYIRAGLTNPDYRKLPFEATQMVSQNIRPLDKIRFPTCEYFIPERNFCYIGYTYR